MPACGKDEVDMSREIKGNHKHLSLSQRLVIEKGLSAQISFAETARQLHKDPSTISKEVRRHREYVTRKLAVPIPCGIRADCKLHYLCPENCATYCKICPKPGRRCSEVCPEYSPVQCAKLDKPPYVCNGCPKKLNCLLQKSFYSAKYADDSYRDTLISAREGINQSPVDIALLDAMISPLLAKGQSLAHIYASHASEIPCCRKTLYNYIDKSVFSARNIDLRRRVRYKVRKKPTRSSLLVREFRNGRTYDDFQKIMREHPDTAVVEMDTVEGTKGGKVFLTLLFRNCSLMLVFLLAEKTQDCVSEIFDHLTKVLGLQIFQTLFPVILTDNGTEFQHPNRLECEGSGEKRTRIYYCNPHSSWQKGMIEKNHQYIRLVIPKGKSFEKVTPGDARLLTNHINSEARDSLNGCTPFMLSQLMLSNRLHAALGLEEIPPDHVTLRPYLLM